MVVAPIDGVVNEFPDPIAVPPVEIAYQLRVPLLAVAASTTAPASHLEAGVVLVIVGDILTVAVTTVRDEVQPK